MIYRNKFSLKNHRDAEPKANFIEKKGVKFMSREV